MGCVLHVDDSKIPTNELVLNEVSAPASQFSITRTTGLRESLTASIRAAVYVRPLAEPRARANSTRGGRFEVKNSVQNIVVPQLNSVFLT